MIVRATFSNSAYKNVTDYTVSPSGALKPTDKLVTISYKEFGETKTTTVSISVSAIKVTVPSQNGSLTYTGSSLSPTWKNYDTSLMTISGTTSGTNAGSYTAKFTLKDKTNYTWSDGTTADKSVTWTIGKAQASINFISTPAVTLNKDRPADIVRFATVGMDSITVTSSDTSIATAITYQDSSSHVVEITNVNETNGTAHIHIGGTVNSNYNAPSYPSIYVSAEFAIPVMITITNTYDSSTTGTKRGGYVEYNGVQYTDDTSFVANIGDIITCRTYISQNGSSPDSYIKLNGVVVVDNNVDSTSGEAFYEYVVIADTEINLHHTYSSYYGGGHSGTNITIVAVPEDHVTIHITGSGNANDCYVSIDGMNYTSTESIVVPVGAEVYCKVKAGSSEPSFIKVNGTKVAETGSSGYVEYTLTVNYNTEILVSYGLGQYASEISILEIPEGHALVQITGSGGSYAYGLVGVTIDGTNYTTTQKIVVPVGTVITCSIVTTTTGEEDGYVKVNGTKVLSVPSGQGTYNYTVTGNIIIYISTVRDADKNRTGYITITEQ